MDELEKTMALLAFPDMRKSPVAYLVEPSQRQKVASELNAAILVAQCQEKGNFKNGNLITTKDPKLPGLLKMCKWAQEQLSEKLVFPKMNFATAELEEVDPMVIS